ncbi:hypothetical protein AC790_08825 [Pantoea sp. RIT-PI-b]|uniref:hypothetical protein n=1 Tax=Pantoea sp. RIT-PI-b TaxID=1681195 RepID=UPI000676116A|nr:hypothetical protein [Pantoea sp. RIT-PI-b]KNC14294.1 hypothetical protein AC790_08825 [Pantoea sp. RIT-PI-b]
MHISIKKGIPFTTVEVNGDEYFVSYDSKTNIVTGVVKKPTDPIDSGTCNVGGAQESVKPETEIIFDQNQSDGGNELSDFIINTFS